TRAERPIIVAGGWFSTEKAEVTAAVNGDNAYMSHGDEEIYVADNPDGADYVEVRTLGGERYRVPQTPARRGARWYDRMHGVFRVGEDEPGVAIAGYDRGASTPRWARWLGSDAIDARVAAWRLHVPLIELVRTTRTDVLKLDPSTGVTSTLASAPATD